MKRFPRHYPGGLLGPEGAPIKLEVFLCTLCPYSRKAFEEVHKIVSHYDGRVQVRINLWIQPWHAQDVLLTKSVVAAGLLNRSAGWKLLDQIYQNLHEFSDEKVYRLSPEQIFNKLASLVEKDGIDRREFLDMVHSEEVLWRIKWMTRYGRQNGIHWSPSFMLQGFLLHEVDSTWGFDKWQALLNPIMREVDQYERTRGPEHFRQEQHFPSQYRGSLSERDAGRERTQPEWGSDYHRGYERSREPGVFDKVKEMFTGEPTDREREQRERDRRAGYAQQPQPQQTQQPGMFGKVKDLFGTDSWGRDYGRGAEHEYRREHPETGTSRTIGDRDVDREKGKQPQEQPKLWGEREHGVEKGTSTGIAGTQPGTSTTSQGEKHKEKETSVQAEQQQQQQPGVRRIAVQ
jgi:hypothetical protein